MCAVCVCERETLAGGMMDSAVTGPSHSPGDGNSPEFLVPFGDGFLDGSPLGTYPQWVAGVFNVAP